MCTEKIFGEIIFDKIIFDVTIFHEMCVGAVLGDGMIIENDSGQNVS